MARFLSTGWDKGQKRQDRRWRGEKTTNERGERRNINVK